MSVIWNFICPMDLLNNYVRGGPGVKTKDNYHHPVSGGRSGGRSDGISFKHSPSEHHLSPPVSGVDHKLGKLRSVLQYQKSNSRNPIESVVTSSNKEGVASG